MDLTTYIRDIPDFPKPGILFKDITPLLAAPAAFRHAIDELASHYRGRPIDAVAAAEARGFIFAAPLALALQFAPLAMLHAQMRTSDPSSTRCRFSDLDAIRVRECRQRDLRTSHGTQRSCIP